MNFNTNFSDIVAIFVISAVASSIFHAKDVSAAAMLPSLVQANSNSAQTQRGFDSPVHLDFHTHVDRQSLSSLINSVNHDKPLTSARHMKKTYKCDCKKDDKLRDGFLGMNLPSIA